jgi:hypothetical protein
LVSAGGQLAGALNGAEPSRAGPRHCAQSPGVCADVGTINAASPQTRSALNALHPFDASNPIAALISIAAFNPFDVFISSAAFVSFPAFANLSSLIRS